MTIHKKLAVLQSATTGLLIFLIVIFALIVSMLVLYSVVLPLLLGDADFIKQFSTYNGYFSTWTLFQQPPSVIDKIIRVDGNKVIWVETKTGDFYSKSFYRFGKEKYLPWKKQKEANFAPTNIYSEHFGSCEFDNADDFEKSFRKPPEKVAQCSRLEEWAGNSVYIWYFALSENGNLWVYEYWEDEFVALCTLCFTTIGILTLFFAILRFGLGRLKLRFENAQ